MLYYKMGFRMFQQFEKQIILLTYAFSSESDENQGFLRSCSNKKHKTLKRSTCLLQLIIKHFELQLKMVQFFSVETHVYFFFYKFYQLNKKHLKYQIIWLKRIVIALNCSQKLENCSKIHLFFERKSYTLGWTIQCFTGMVIHSCNNSGCKIIDKRITCFLALACCYSRMQKYKKYSPAIFQSFLPCLDVHMILLSV